MSESFNASDIYARLAGTGLIKNRDGTYAPDPTIIPVPATPNPSPLNAVASKDIIVNHVKPTWMRLYVPTTALNGGVSSKKLPLVVFYHGGGFLTHSFDYEPVEDFCNLMARQLNVVVASASYRRGTETRLPAVYDDGVAAVEWIKNSEHEWIKSHADLSNVFLMGTHSGGNVAYNVCLRFVDTDLRPLRIRGLILHEPFFGGVERCESELRHVNDQILRDFCWEIRLPVGADRDHKYSNPRVGGGPEDMEKIGRIRCKVMVIGEGGSALIDRQRDVANLMKEMGVDVVECFTDRDPDVLAYITSIIYSSAP
ncbi:unnamed protein product [Eruca vesicaria subsp. sativa]|uniref:Alpha/beta hydrolase fold-3 domain-containing protein n=1 Tax=Eruca vesicaria subsp. sativa TaxID=29727 RepID=A0ABC8LX96_ERUVS|nr:unnamed protein product [Eruca vesicaria subsp. sativa]